MLFIMRKLSWSRLLSFFSYQTKTRKKQELVCNRSHLVPAKEVAENTRYGLNLPVTERTCAQISVKLKGS